MPAVSRFGDQTSKRREWRVVAAGRHYRVICEWNIGSLRMEWAADVSAKVPKADAWHWRRIKGLWLIAAVREYENAQHINEQLQR